MAKFCETEFFWERNGLVESFCQAKGKTVPRRAGHGHAARASTTIRIQDYSNMSVRSHTVGISMYCTVFRQLFCCQFVHFFIIDTI